MTDDLFDDKDMPHMSIAHIAVAGQPGESDVKIPDPGHVEVLPESDTIPGCNHPRKPFTRGKQTACRSGIQTEIRHRGNLSDRP